MTKQIANGIETRDRRDAVRPPTNVSDTRDHTEFPIWTALDVCRLRCQAFLALAAFFFLTVFFAAFLVVFFPAK